MIVTQTPLELSLENRPCHFKNETTPDREGVRAVSVDQVEHLLVFRRGAISFPLLTARGLRSHVTHQRADRRAKLSGVYFHPLVHSRQAVAEKKSPHFFLIIMKS